MKRHEDKLVILHDNWIKGFAPKVRRLVCALVARLQNDFNANTTALARAHTHIHTRTHARTS